jgi:hypothetical protein
LQQDGIPVECFNEFTDFVCCRAPLFPAKYACSDDLPS